MNFRASPDMHRHIKRLDNINNAKPKLGAVTERGFLKMSEEVYGPPFECV